MSERQVTASISFDPAQLQRLDDLVHGLKRRGLRRASRSAVIREALRSYLEAQGARGAETPVSRMRNPPETTT